MIKALILSILLPTILATGLQTENDLTDPKFLGAIIDGVISGLVDAGFAALNQFLSGLFVSPTIQTILGFLGKREMPDPKILGAIIDGVIDNLVDAGFAALNQLLSNIFVSPTVQTLLGFLGKRDLNADLKFLQSIINGVISGLVDAGFAVLNQFLSGLFVHPTIQTILGFLGKREIPDLKFLQAIISGVVNGLVDAGFAALNQFLSGLFVSPTVQTILGLFGKRDLSADIKFIQAIISGVVNGLVDAGFAALNQFLSGLFVNPTIQTILGFLGKRDLNADLKFLQSIINGVISGLVDAGFAALNQFLSGLFVHPTIQTILGFLGRREIPDAKFLSTIISGVIDGLVNAGFAALNQFLSGLFVNPTIQTILGFLGKRDLNADIKFIQAIISGVIDGLVDAGFAALNQFLSSLFVNPTIQTVLGFLGK
jgi:hypothetical protein